ncbi:hypothetical protein MS6207_03955 [Escherichia coli]|nr:hypothetical protein [Escherichia coli]
MDNAILNSELIAIQAGNIIVYNYDGGNRELFLHQLNILLLALVFRHILVWMLQAHIKQVMRFSVQRI